MNSDYYYNNISLSEILHTTDTSGSYYKNMSKEDVQINPLSAAFPFGYNLPTGSFPYSDDNSYREAFYTDYTSTQTVTPPTWATHFSAILIGQGGAGGGGGGGYYMLQDGGSPYFSGGHGTNGTAGTARVLDNIAFDNEIDLEISVGSNNYTDNKGITNGRNRNVSWGFPTAGKSGQNGSDTTLTYNTDSTSSKTITAYGGTGGAGGTVSTMTGLGSTSIAITFSYIARQLYTNVNYYPPPINTDTNPPTTSFGSFNKGDGYTNINVNYYTGSGGVGGNGGWGDANTIITRGYPGVGVAGSLGLCRIYWKGK